MTTRAGFLALLLAAAPLAAQQQGAVDAAAIVAKAARSYGALSSMQADFRMRVVDPQLGNEDSRGVLSQAGKNRFVMRFSSPAKEFYLIDGTNEYQYFPSITKDQVHQRPAPSGGAYGTNYLAWFLENSVERYDLRYLKSETVNGQLAYVVEMTPRSRDFPFRKAVVWFDSGDGLPRRLDIDEVPNHRIIDLTNLQKNLLLGDSVFKFTKPAGARIVTPK